MADEILYTTARSSSGELVHISEAEKGFGYFCPCCGGELIVKKSGKRGKGSRRPHFAHKTLSPNCTPESALHFSFKQRSVDLLQNLLENQSDFEFKWNCDACTLENTGNLLARTRFVEEEYQIQEYRPDIALLDEGRNVLAVIEIVVTHPPEERTITFYKDNSIVLIRIDLISDEALLRVGERLATPDSVDYCLSSECETNYRFAIPRKMAYREDRCNLCLRPTVKFEVLRYGVFGVHPTRRFTEQEINLVKSRFPNIRIVTDKTTKARYPKAVCRYCGRIQRRARSRSRL